jgi:hypothetical protein
MESDEEPRDLEFEGDCLVVAAEVLMTAARLNGSPDVPSAEFVQRAPDWFGRLASVVLSDPSVVQAARRAFRDLECSGDLVRLVEERRLYTQAPGAQ